MADSQTVDQPQMPPPCTMIIFGASGDLTKRKLMPALFRLMHLKQLPPEFTVLGFSRSFEDHYDFRSAMEQAVRTFYHSEPIAQDEMEAFKNRLFYISADFKDPSCFDDLKKQLDEIESKNKTSNNRLFYCATPPSFYSAIAEQLGTHGLSHPASGKSWTRIVVEKPFGRDLKSAMALNEEISKHFEEPQIYRIDHYLGKETVQNLLALRFANEMFEPIWNRNYIDHVQITAAETVGLENRASYYEQAGALRDMVQSHIMQVLAHIGLEPPVSFEAESVRNEVVQVFQSMEAMTPEQIDASTVRGQYLQGTWADETTPAYLREKGVNAASKTETFVAVKFFVDNWRWAGVPFYLRTGKRLKKRATEVILVFKKIPYVIFRMMGKDHIAENALHIRIQPDEGISLCFNAKKPGSGMHIEEVKMDFSYAKAFHAELADAYERLLVDCMLGDPTLFARRDAVEESWKIITPILDAWQNSNVATLPQYAPGSWGPKESDELIERDLRKWIGI